MITPDKPSLNPYELPGDKSIKIFSQEGVHMLLRMVFDISNRLIKLEDKLKGIK